MTKQHDELMKKLPEELKKFAPILECKVGVKLRYSEKPQKNAEGKWEWKPHNQTNKLAVKYLVKKLAPVMEPTSPEMNTLLNLQAQLAELGEARKAEYQAAKDAKDEATSARTQVENLVMKVQAGNALPEHSLKALNALADLALVAANAKA